MLFAIGTRVRFRFTGETGTITGMLDDGMLRVRLDDDPDFEIPAFEDDLVRNSEMEPGSPGAKFVAGKQEPKGPEKPPRRELKHQYVILKPRGVQLAFEPMPGRDGFVSKYKIWLLNDTQHEFLTEFDLIVNEENMLSSDDKLGPATAIEIGDLLADQLNDHPEIDLTVRRITTAGPDEPLSKTVKIKAKQFFNQFQTALILNVQAYVYVVFDRFEKSDEKSSSADDLRQYTLQKARKPRSSNHNNSGSYQAFNVEEFAHFEPEIDLHIENLSNGYARLDKGEILRIQLVHFNRFIDRAIRLGAHRVFVIHGVGEGKLRDAIAQELRSRHEVVKFKNEFHPKYGYGATEVVLR